MVLYVISFTIVFVVLFIAVLVNVTLRLKDRYYRRFEHDLGNAKSLDDILFR